MKKMLSFIVTFLSITTFAQNFEGKVTYQNSYQSKDKYTKALDLSNQFGSQLTCYFKGSNYKIVSNGAAQSWQLYRGSDNKIFEKWLGNETISYNEGSFRNDKLLNVQLNKQAATILGQKCDELVLTSKTGTQKYYYSLAYKLDGAAFSAHDFNNWNEYIKKANAVPLKIVIENNRYINTKTAIQVTPQRINASEFELPAGAKTEPIAL